MRVLGVSPDPVKAVKKFHDKQALNFTLLADEDHAVCEAYGVWAEKSMYGKTYWGALRATFIIDGEGTIAHVIPKASPKTHDDEVLKALGAGRGLAERVGSGPVRSPRSSASIRSISSWESSKSKMSMFCSIRSGVIDFGKTTLPSWMCQRRTIWPGVRPCASAISTITGSSRAAPCASGLQASVTMPRSACSRRRPGCVRYGCSSIWLTAGVTPVSSMIRRRWAGWKFETPIARASPAFCASISACQAST